jgi:hypothetical protein
VGVIEWMHRYSDGISHCETWNVKEDVSGCLNVDGECQFSEAPDAQKNFKVGMLVHVLKWHGKSVCVSQSPFGGCWWIGFKNDVNDALDFESYQWMR